VHAIAAAQRQAAWVAGQTAAAAVLILCGVWTDQPELGLCLSLGFGVSLLHLEWIWAMPLVTTAVVAGGLAASSAGVSPMIGAGAVAGGAASLLWPEATDRFDRLHAALATSACATLGVWFTHQWVPGLGTSPVLDLVGAALVAWFASFGLWTLAIRLHSPTVPSARRIRKSLQAPYRPAAQRAADLFHAGNHQAPDADSRQGMAEVATWVFRLQCTLQTLDDELATIDPNAIKERIRLCEVPDADAFTRERKQATARHLRRLLDHRGAIAIERQRTEVLVDYAIAFLEEARAGLAVARELPGEAAPDRLPEVLDRLRSHAANGDARRRTAREMGQMS
jgi:hypothetical protein